MKKLDALIIDRDIDVRMRLRHATSSVATFGKVLQCGSFEESMAKLSEVDEDPIDIIFVSHQFPQEAVKAFISDAKNSRRGLDAAFVLIVGARDDKNAKVAENILAGADGFLFEPYSIDELVNMSELAARVKGERAAAREIIALKFIVRDLTRYVDLLHLLAVSGCENSQSWDRLRKVHERLGQLQPQSLKAYFEMLTEAWELLPFPDPKLARAKYDGKSPRVRQRLEGKLLELAEGSTVTQSPPKGVRLPPPINRQSKNA